MNKKSVLISAALAAVFLASASGCSSDSAAAPRSTAEVTARGSGDGLGDHLFAHANPGLAAKPAKSSDLASVPQE